MSSHQPLNPFLGALNKRQLLLLIRKHQRFEAAMEEGRRRQQALAKRQADKIRESLLRERLRSESHRLLPPPEPAPSPTVRPQKVDEARRAALSLLGAES